MRPMSSMGTPSQSMEESLRSFFTNPENLSRLMSQSINGMRSIQSRVNESAERSSSVREPRTTSQVPSDIFHSLMSGIFASFRHENKATAKSTLDALPKIILKAKDSKGEDEDDEKLKIDELKSRLDFLGISYAGFLEKSEFLTALRNTSCVRPEVCSAAGCPTCTICMANFEPGDRVTKLPCGHWFHLGNDREGKNSGDEGENCPGVVKWLGSNSTCPNCKDQLPKQCDAARATESVAPRPDIRMASIQTITQPYRRTDSTSSTEEPAPKRRRR